MSVKRVIADRLEKAREFADSVRAVYEDAYSKADELRKGGGNELIKEIHPAVKTTLEGGYQRAQTALDDFNQSLADKAIPSFRKSAVSREQLEQKAKGAQKKSVKGKTKASQQKNGSSSSKATQSVRSKK
ncbi:hypothetical protein [Alkalimarinus alittae]|uniref:Uncharacterized protein n=1 Tax=Alkalimarinus alittae TaxID=2961619 RepID=A0ABY6N625_9ALTE|nr:hypothetical protein [Alkalimarinus alittae]UZE97444.1 hypothetical protein NKI27_06760 [Alkalimarinus alittae]